MWTKDFDFYIQGAIMRLSINGAGFGNFFSSGINTNSKKYQAAIKRLGTSWSIPTKSKMLEQHRQLVLSNWMKKFDADGDYIDPVTGMAGLCATGIPISERHKIISVSEDARQKMFDEVKCQFIAENGNKNGRTTRRSEVFQAYQRSVSKSDRLKGTWTLEQYERQYRQAMIKAVKDADPSWDFGKPFNAKVLDNVTRESVESFLVSNGVNLKTKTIDYSI